MLGKALMAAAALIVSSGAAAQWHNGPGSASGLDSHGSGGVGYDQVIGAAILDDISSDRQAEREARREPYASPGYGPIETERQAADACGERARRQVGQQAKLYRSPVANTMSTGWEVEGTIDPGAGEQPVPFVCSVRNGSVSSVILR